MKHLSILFFTFFTIGCGTTKNTEPVYFPLNGIWIPVRQEIGGNELPQSVYKNDILIIGDSTYSVTAENIDLGSLMFTRDHMKIIRKKGVNEGNYYYAMYRYENEQLIICYHLTSGRHPAGFDTKNDPGLFLSTYKRKVLE